MTVTILVPVFEGADFVGETLQSAVNQTRTDLQIVVSIDRSLDPSWAICRTFEADPRVRLIAPTRRFGWIDHCNRLIADVATPYFCILPHDDVLQPDYIERLLDVAEATPEAAVVYSDLGGLGRLSEPRSGQPVGALDPAWRLVQAPVVGEPVERLLAFLAGHFAAIGFRGLVRTTSAIRSGGPRAGVAGGFAADSVWLARLAWEGDLVRVPEVLYRKRYHDRSEHHRWFKLDRDDRLAAWRRHCLELADWIVELDLAASRRREVLQVWRARACGDCASLAFPEVGEQSAEELTKTRRHLRRHPIVRWAGEG